MILVIAEKPSVSGSLSKVIGVANRKKGYFEGNGYLVSSPASSSAVIKSTASAPMIFAS